MARSLLAVVLVASVVALILGASHHCRHGATPFIYGLLPRKALSVSASFGLKDSPSPTCTNLDCPPYKLVSNEGDFEIRDYREAAWVETDPLLDVSFNKAGVTGFRMLFKYIQGDNLEGAQVPMTAPVLTTIKPSGGPFCSSTFIVRFFVPPKFSEQPPQPGADLAVHIAKLPRRCVAVRRFPGFATDFNIAQEAKNLADSLKGSSWANITAAEMGEAYSIAQYNSPFELFNRQNEVWVPFEGKEDCSPASPSLQKDSQLLIVI